mmetsp:Transcript_30527/g.75233  ORF Transcript_30527/g.75233 Transcript_30527/m.75233 type:complete len:229 (+) Transcript_30527:301-987(+)
MTEGTSPGAPRISVTTYASLPSESPTAASMRSDASCTLCLRVERVDVEICLSRLRMSVLNAEAGMHPSCPVSNSSNAAPSSSRFEANCSSYAPASFKSNTSRGTARAPGGRLTLCEDATRLSRSSSICSSERWRQDCRTASAERISTATSRAAAPAIVAWTESNSLRGLPDRRIGASSTSSAASTSSGAPNSTDRALLMNSILPSAKGGASFNRFVRSPNRRTRGSSR